MTIHCIIIPNTRIKIGQFYQTGERRYDRKKPFTLVVAKDGTGDYSTVTEALAALGEEGEPALIYIKKVYIRNA